MDMEFKKCSACGFVWSDRNDFLGDPDIALIGYQVNFKQLTAGLFLFNHDCKGTLAIDAAQFTDLYGGPIFIERMADGPECSGHCFHESDLKPCPNQCECAFVREIIQKINNWPKRSKVRKVSVR
jgi:hypothetical protein